MEYLLQRNSIKKYHILIYPRRGYEINIPEQYSSKVSIVDAPLIEISSTQIRERLSQMKDITFYVPEDVEKYIVMNKLYMQ